jgi:hypothetical protein
MNADAAAVKLSKTGKPLSEAQLKKEANLGKISADLESRGFKHLAQRMYMTKLLTPYRTNLNTYETAIRQLNAEHKATKVEDSAQAQAQNKPKVNKTRKATPMSKANQLRALQEEVALEEKAKEMFMAIYGKEPKADSRNDAARLAKIVELIKEGKANANIKTGVAELNSHMKEKAAAKANKTRATKAAKKVNALKKPISEMTACELCELEKAQSNPAGNANLMARLANLRIAATERANSQ